MFTFYMPKKVEMVDALERSIYENSKELQITHLFLLYSESAVKEAQLKMIAEEMRENQLQLSIYPMPKGEPTLSTLKKVTETFVELQCDGIAAVGGGSVIDLAKGIAAIAKNNQQQFKQLATYERIERYPLIAIPTTAGTGSEATKVTVVTDEVENVKYNPGHPQLIPDVVILMPALTLHVPPTITAQTGLDALTHAVEAYVSTKANEFSDFYALRAIRFIGESLQTAVLDGANMEARKKMLLGSFYAGMAFSNASTNLAHATGRALGTRWDVPHGLSVALTHPFVVAFSYESCKERYNDIAKALGIESGEELSAYLSILNDKLGIWESARHLVTDDYLQSIEEMTNNAISGNGILTNVRIPQSDDIQEIYKNIFLAIQNRNAVQS